MSSRKSFDELFMETAKLWSERSTCIRRHVGAVLVKENRVISTGYNGAPRGLTHCDELGCLRKELNVPSGQRHEICRAVHAEQNAILQAAYFGVSTKDASIYVTDTPCSICAKFIINAGIKEVVVDSEYPDKMAMDMLEEAKIKVRKLEKK